MKLIERSDLLQVFAVYRLNKYANNHFLNGIETAMNIVKSAPTIDVVKCDECASFRIAGNKSFCDEFGGYVTEEDCCSRGKVKDE